MVRRIEGPGSKIGIEMALRTLRDAEKDAEKWRLWRDINLCTTCATMTDEITRAHDESVIRPLNDMEQVIALVLPRVVLAGSFLCASCFDAHSRTPGEVERLLTDEDFEFVRQAFNPGREDMNARRELLSTPMRVTFTSDSPWSRRWR